MTLEQATHALLAAIEAEDLDALAQALETRATAIRATPAPSGEAVAAGQRAQDALRGLQQRWASESARLDQMRAGYGAF